MTNQKQQPSNKVGIIKGILFFCAGVEKEIQDDPSFKVEHGKYISIGAAVLFTAILAMFSGGYALHSVFQSKKISFLFGFLWGIIILNLDRLIILSIKKKEETLSREQRIPVLFRIFLAITIGLIVSEPLKLKLFEQEIQKEIVTINLERNLQRREGIKRDNDGFKNFQYQIDDLEKAISAESTRLNNLRNEKIKEGQKFRGEAGGNKGAGLTGLRGYGPESKKIEDSLKNYEVEIKQLENSLKEMRNKIFDDKAKQEQIILTEENKLKKELMETGNLSSFLDSFVALERMSDNNWTVRVISWFITFLFILIEIIPVALKLTMSKGVYEELLDEKENEARGSIEFSKMLQEVRKDVYEISLATEKEKIEAKIEAGFETAKSDIQTEADQDNLFRELVNEQMTKTIIEIVQVSGESLAQSVVPLLGKNLEKNISQNIQRRIDKVDQDDSDNALSLGADGKALQSEEQLESEFNKPNFLVPMDEASQEYEQYVSKGEYAKATEVAGYIYEMYEKYVQSLKSRQGSDEYINAVAWSSYWKLRRDLYDSMLEPVTATLATTETSPDKTLGQDLYHSKGEM